MTLCIVKMNNKDNRFCLKKILTLVTLPNEKQWFSNLDVFCCKSPIHFFYICPVLYVQDLICMNYI